MFLEMQMANINLEISIEPDWEPAYNYSIMNMKEAREVIEVREQIQEDLLAYLEGVMNCLPVDMQDDDVLTDVCNIVVRNFDKLG